MLFGKNIKFLVFVIGAMLSLQYVNANLIFYPKKESEMTFITKKHDVIFLNEPSKKEYDYFSTFSDIQFYINRDHRIAEADKILGLSGLLSHPHKQIKQINIGLALDKQPVLKLKSDNVYNIKTIIEKEYMDEIHNTIFAQDKKITILKTNEKYDRDITSEAEINIYLLTNDISNRFTQYLFIQSLCNNSAPHFTYIEGPKTLGIISAKHKIFEESVGSLKWIYYNSSFELKSSNIPEQDVMQIAQWIFDNIEFIFAD
ncbi:hypothetical protein [Gilliamella intestini]|uniref:Uncharacterized protein n=1 Tax=Gilliamella intestini TaxID=1798183 RepID=A0A1C4DE19_9GAMM|nr:hypothetical protein [Gilliamella intestini]SCC29624.1 hypothetical protein GA0061080_10702 [Gilliamella intestini]